MMYWLFGLGDFHSKNPNHVRVTCLASGKISPRNNSQQKVAGTHYAATPHTFHSHSAFLSLPIPMSNNASRKRAAPPSQPPPAKQAVMTQEEEFMDEDVFINETLVSEDEESLILRDIEQRQALANRLSKWTRPPLSAGYVAQSRSVRECFPLIISPFLWC